MAPPHNPVVFVHGYSDSGRSWGRWRDILRQRLGVADALMRTCSYVSLNNEITIKDIAEGFDRALGAEGGLAADEPFDAIVHSTGMLVVRAWLAADPLRAKRLKRLVAFAPATFGSPLAKEGRSWLGAVFKGNKHLGPDFLEAGNRILLDLELASEFTWRLAEEDMFGAVPRYDAGPDTPFVFVFCGTGTYRGLRKIADKPDTDGTVRRSGCGMNVRAIELDMTASGMVARRASQALAGAAQLEPVQRIVADKWMNVSIPVHLVGDPQKGDVNHATILSDPPPELVDLAIDALTMTDSATAPGGDPAAGYTAWLAKADAAARFKRLLAQYQQFVVHAVDERGDPIADYNLQLYRTDGGPAARVEEFDAEVEVYSANPSYRSFLVDVARLLPQAGRPPPSLAITIVASSGTEYVAYLGYGCEPQTEPGSTDASLAFDGAQIAGIELFRPYTTTLIRLYLERQVLPLDPKQPASLLTWDAPDTSAVAIV